MPTNNIVINGKQYGDNVSGLEDLKIKVKYNSDNSFDLAVSSPLTFIGEAYDLLKAKFIDRNAGISETQDIILSLDCCENNFNFKIITDDFKIKCYDQEIKARIKYANVNEDKYNLLRERIFWSNRDGTLGTEDFSGFRRPQIVREENRDFLNGLFNGSRYIPSPLFTDILDYAISVTGLDSWESNFMSRAPYNKLCMVGPASNKAPKSRSQVYLKDFLPNLTFAQVLETASPLFRASYRFRDNKIVWQSKNSFEQPEEILFNIDQEYKAGRLSEDVEFVFNNDPETYCAIHHFEYQQDAIDGEARDVAADYNEVVIYDQGGNKENLKGECRTLIPYHLINFDKGRPGFQRHRNGPQPKIYLFNDEHETVRYLSFKKEIDTSLYNQFYKDFAPTLESNPRFLIEKIIHSPENFCETSTKLLEKESFQGGISSKFGTFIFDEATIDFGNKTITYERLKLKPE